MENKLSLESQKSGNTNNTRESYEDYQSRKMVEEKNSKVQRLLAMSNAPKRHLACVCDVNPLPTGKGFIYILCGTRGTGKTQTAVATIKQACYQSQDAIYVTAIELSSQIKATFKRDSKESEYDLLRRYQSHSLLVIDELNERSNSQWEASLINHIVTRRYDDLLDTILITNEQPSKLSTLLSPSICDRANESGSIIEFRAKKRGLVSPPPCV